MTKQITLLALAYFLGAIPFGVLIAKAKGVDLQKFGSGNTGATNVFRALGLVAGGTAFLADGAKGYLACWLMNWFLPDQYLMITLAGAFALIGHSYSLFLKGKGGKGAATGVGIMLFLAPVITLIIAITVAVLIFTTRYVSLATLTAATLTPVLFIIYRQPTEYLFLAVVAGVFIWYKHIANMKRLVVGTENKI
ncbi:MAG: glycerol-3-phosphate 1-O-acyltransferase PlsY [Candidatus Margulisiibacteriota bacterium]|jgi:glycerol-3-phosphate acyltransferase PlsY